MKSQSYTCPSCGGSLKVENRFSKLIVCEYCSQPCLITPNGLDPSGEKAQLADFPSIFEIGKSGTIQGIAFKVLGRMRYEYEDGFWDEWFLQYDNGKKIWLQEDEGEFTAFEKETLTSPVPGFDETSVGTIIHVNNLSIFITEKNKASIAGAQGELYFRTKPGDTVNCVDGNAAGKLISIEYTTNEINLSLGAEIDVSEIHFS